MDATIAGEIVIPQEGAGLLWCKASVLDQGGQEHGSHFDNAEAIESMLLGEFLAEPIELLPGGALCQKRGRCGRKVFAVDDALPMCGEPLDGGEVLRGHGV